MSGGGRFAGGVTVADSSTGTTPPAPAHGFGRALSVAFVVALVCGGLVSVTAVLLEPRQRANQLAERKALIDQIVARLPGVESLLGVPGTDRIESRVVNLATGDDVPGVDPGTYDAVKAAQDPATRVEIPPEHDVARIGARASYAAVLLARQGRTLRLVILPVYGAGYASTLRGFLALDGDLNTVVALVFYEHAETPGLGARLQDPDWLRGWRGKRLRDGGGQYRLQVARGRAEADSSAAPYTVDGISGATRTSQGVSQLLRYWLGDHGFGPFLQRLRKEGGAP